MPEHEKDSLFKQAAAQAEKFEVMNKRDVSALSRVCNLLSQSSQNHLTSCRNSEPSMSAAIIYARPTSLCAQVARSYTVA